MAYFTDLSACLCFFRGMMCVRISAGAPPPCRSYPRLREGGTAIPSEYELPPSLAALLAQLDQQGIRDHRRYQYIRSYLTFRARASDIPISGSFELTPLCNLDCRMCYVHLHPEQMQGAALLPAKTWISLMRQAIDAGMLYARLTGGECLTYPDFQAVYLFLQEQGVETTLLTNGVLLNSRWISFFRAHPPAGIQITLYGASEAAYARVTGRRVFAKVYGAICSLREAGFPLTVGITPNAYMDDGEDMVRLLHDLGVPCRINSGLMAPRPETGRRKADSPVEAYIRLIKLQKELEGAVDWASCEEASLPRPGGDGGSAQGVRCGAGRNSFCITWDGLLRPCNTFPAIAQSVLELPFKAAWRQINAQVKEFPLPVECQGCAYASHCKHCAAEHASDAPIGHASPAICDWMRRMTAAGIIRL